MHQHAEVHCWSFGKVKFIVGICVGRKPIAPVDLLPIGFENGESLIALGNTFASHLDDLQVSLIDPDTPLKKTFADFLRHDLRRNVENTSVQLIKSLVTKIFEVVLINLG